MRHENASESSDLKQEKDAILLLNEVLRRKAIGLFRISGELKSCGKGWSGKWREVGSVVPLGIFHLSLAEFMLAFIGAAVLFLPRFVFLKVIRVKEEKTASAFFVFLPKLIQWAMKADANAIIETFGKNEQVKKVFWAMFAAVAGLVLAKILDPVAVRQIVGMIT